MERVIKNKGGYCWYEFIDGYVHIYNLYVKPEFRNKGYAKDLLTKTIKAIRSKGWTDEIQVVCNPTEEGIDKERLGNFYESLGLTVYEYYG